MEDTDIKALHPNLAFWSLDTVQQIVLLMAVRGGVSVAALMESYSHTYSNVKEGHRPDHVRLLGYYLAGLEHFQERWHLT